MKYLILFLAIALHLGTSAQTPAFPGAEGGGMFSVGGRGGKVFYVNSLEDTIVGDKTTREGTLRWCLERKGRKTILFKVAGIIHLKKRLVIKDSTTIAGQSAPGDGICIADNNVKIDGHEVVVRYLRFRLGDVSRIEDDAISGYRKKNIIIDHCSMSWSTDECASFYDNENFTMQWCIISESLRASVHRKGSHGYGGIWGGHTATFHHNLLADHDSRNPRMCGGRFSNRSDLELVDFRNNVIFNWGANSSYGAEGGRYNYIGNYYKPTANSSNKGRILSPNADIGDYKQAPGIWGSFFLSGNYVDGKPEVTKDNILGFQPSPVTKNKSDLLVNKPFETPFVSTQSAVDAYREVLADAGASFRRDKTDTRIVDEVARGLIPLKATRDYGTKAGFIDSQNDVGGWDNYCYDLASVPLDSNIDGIPDGWLEKNFPGKKANDTNSEGYTYLEVYLNNLLLKNN
jgi:pectate lyase